MQAYLGIDVGSVSTNLVLLNQRGELLRKLYLRSQGNPVGSVQEGLSRLGSEFPDLTIAGVGTTGSGRQLIGKMVGADLIKNEITAHAVACLNLEPTVQTIIEIGGQDSKLILIRDGVVYDFAMNTVCAAGTGSFLDQQAARLSIGIEELGMRAAQGRHPVRIAGRCAVFAESDMIHKQQMGHKLEDILAGLCRALVRNFLGNLGKGKELKAPVIFQGGVAANLGIRQAFEEALNCPLVIPEHFDVMGAVGAALLARDEMLACKSSSKFKGLKLLMEPVATQSFDCEGCSNQCEVVEMRQSGLLVACIGDKCGKWSQRANSRSQEPETQVG
ncbi:putative CoA-substrate-specific enzyme activase [Hydrogenispora ethanolica]|uniref:Putative CoA-substrate-specific enzyme activase n=1 Tax=Hydrogenispora ethanolica TaxID=1082276 RepID=A0A4R1RSI9_HYDET|nr:acyl-CoA dehydratase activase [Hydrogenispora ethanolica]TCL69336.1 putative CoA-substrate-specific enzyme activase [Hydrogenispora ethanolica]